MKIKKIGVLGAGAMGSGIAHVAAQSGYDVVLGDLDMSFIEKAVSRIGKLLDKNVAKGKLSAEQKDVIMGRFTLTTDMNDFADVDYFVEVIIEDMEIKKSTLAKMDKILKPGVIMATNTSSMSITVLASATTRPENFVGMHFFNPVPIMKLCEIIRGYQTTDEAVKVASELAQTFGKTTIEVKKDTPGFVVNRVMMPQFLEAIRLVEEGVATPQDIDTAVTLGLNYPMGPFTLMDFTGIDISKFVLDYFYDETKNDFWAPPYTLKSIINAGKLGRKTGAGWFDYKK